MNIKSYFEVEIRTTVSFAVLGAIAGYISFMANSASVALLVAVVIGVAGYIGMKKFFNIKEETKWWFGNGVGTYIVIWIIVWTIFYNLALR